MVPLLQFHACYRYYNFVPMLLALRVYYHRYYNFASMLLVLMVCVYVTSTTTTTVYAGGSEVLLLFDLIDNSSRPYKNA